MACTENINNMHNKFNMFLLECDKFILLPWRVLAEKSTTEIFGPGPNSNTYGNNIGNIFSYEPYQQNSNAQHCYFADMVWFHKPYQQNSNAGNEPFWLLVSFQ